MPILILLGVGAICGTVAIVNKRKATNKKTENMTEKERTQFVIEQNNKRMDKIMRKYR